MTATPENFNSPEELRALLDLASRRLHYINRVSGESHYMWHLAEVIGAVGELADLISDADTKAAFGNGYSEGTLNQEQSRDRILELLAERLR